MHIGVFGIPGVGKTTFTKKFVNANDGYESISASHLIRMGGGEVFYQNLNSNNLDKNQSIFCREYDKFIKNRKNTIIELHNIIETEAGFYFVDEKYFNKIRLDLIFYLYAQPEKIAFRRIADNTKVKLRKKDSLEQIRDIQNKSIKHIKQIFNGVEKIFIEN